MTLILLLILVWVKFGFWWFLGGLICFLLDWKIEEDVAWTRKQDILRGCNHRTTNLINQHLRTHHGKHF